MMAFGFLILVLGAVLVGVSVLAEAKHPTGGNDATDAAFHDGIIIMEVGIIIMALRWWFG